MGFCPSFLHVLGRWLRKLLGSRPPAAVSVSPHEPGQTETDPHVMDFGPYLIETQQQKRLHVHPSPVVSIVSQSYRTRQTYTKILSFQSEPKHGDQAETEFEILLTIPFIPLHTKAKTIDASS
ncbi:hypothetical protein AVEN_270809-1 [Araneus ventricosus]|uniref:Uncharacterized protein n=1 Tax=Araneus ventricosus TaxID=182803 RepID=A0A4Y2WXC6_ARAVE|nr:hypothetical protein AVEN_270809-1 [Araneus ventricosus]